MTLRPQHNSVASSDFVRKQKCFYNERVGREETSVRVKIYVTVMCRKGFSKRQCAEKGKDVLLFKVGLLMFRWLSFPLRLWIPISWGIGDAIKGSNN